jgi:DNA-binding transcriptional LysR family regulator
VSRFLAPFFTRHPNVGLKIIGVTGSANETREGSDLSIYYYQPPQADLVSLHIGTMHLLPFASREYVRVHGAPQNIEALSRHRLLDLAVYFTEAGLWATWSQQHAGTRALLLTNVAGCIAEAVHHGAGIAVLPSYALAVYDNLIPLDIGVHYTLPIYICYSRDAMDKWPVKATLEFLRECVFDRKNMPWFRERYIAPELDWHRRLESAVDQAGAEPASARAPATVPA